MSASARPRILWGITASVAAIRAPLLAQELLRLGDVQAIATPKARHFLDPLPAEIKLWTDDDEWAAWRNLGDPVVHIELRRWADLLLIAPLSADALAKIAGGISDNLLLSVARAWEFPKPVILAPAMNTRMWEHPITASHLELVGGWGMSVVAPVEKKLACEDIGVGALASPDSIAAAVRGAIAN